MTQFKVSANGTVFGIFQAATAQEARDLCAVDAGYTSEEGMEETLEQPSEMEAEPALSAADIMGAASNASDAMDRAERAVLCMKDIDQDWEHEATLYTMWDDTVLVVSGPQVHAYPSMSEARAALAA